MNRRRMKPHVVPVLPFAPTTAEIGWHEVGWHEVGWHEERGSTLIEILIALGIMGVVLTVFVSVLQLGVLSVSDVQERSTAMTLARSQMEIVKSAPWPGPYPALATPAGYTVSTSIGPGPMPTIQAITVAVRHNGRDILTTQVYKGQR